MKAEYELFILSLGLASYSLSLLLYVLKIRSICCIQSLSLYVHLQEADKGMDADICNVVMHLLNNPLGEC